MAPKKQIQKFHADVAKELSPVSPGAINSPVRQMLSALRRKPTSPLAAAVEVAQVPALPSIAAFPVPAVVSHVEFQERLAKAAETVHSPKTVAADAALQRVVAQPVLVGDVKSGEAMLVKVKHGAAHMVVRVGDVLLYVETQVGGVCAPAKVWVLGKVASAQDGLHSGLELVTRRASTYLSPVVATVEGALVSAQAKATQVALPVHAKIVDGVLYVQGAVGNTKFSIQTRASATLTVGVNQASITCLRVWASSRVLARRVLATKDGMLSAIQSYSTKTQDGFLYVQAVIGDTLVRIKVSASDRLVAPALLALAHAQGVVSGLSKQMIAKALCLYDQVTAKCLDILAPLFEKGASMAAYTKALVDGTVVAVKVRVVTIRGGVQSRLTPVYMKIQNGFVYIQGVVGDKVVFIKVHLSDLVSSLTEIILTTKARIQDSALSAAQSAKCKVDSLRSQAQVAVNDRNVQVTVAGAVGGAASMGMGGGVAGLTTGAFIGAVVSVPAAFFTFGLSIPIGAAVGGATGLCAGAVTGGAVGLVGGGATARSVHKNSDQIKDGASGAFNKASGYKDYVTLKAKGVTDSMSESTVIMKSRLVGGTGGTSSE